MPFTIKTEVDIGHLLTLLTVVGGILAWATTRWRDRVRERKDYAGSGALRLILRLLRDTDQRVISAQKLFERYQHPDTKKARKEYCRMNFLFKDRRQFDAALYTLEEEGKIRFDGGDTVLYVSKERISNALEEDRRMRLSDEDSQRILNAFLDGFNDTKVDAWNLRDIAEVANRVRPEEVQRFLREKLASENWPEKAKATKIIEAIAPA